MSPAPVNERVQATVPGAAAGVASDQTVAEVHLTGKVLSVTYVPEAAVVANGTNFRTFRLLNKGQTGGGAVVIATFATDTVTTDDLAAFDEKTIPLTAVAADQNVVPGDILVWDETIAGTGVASPGGRVEVELTRTG